MALPASIKASSQMIFRQHRPFEASAREAAVTRAMFTPRRSPIGRFPPIGDAGSAHFLAKPFRTATRRRAMMDGVLQIFATLPASGLARRCWALPVRAIEPHTCACARHMPRHDARAPIFIAALAAVPGFSIVAKRAPRGFFSAAFDYQLRFSRRLTHA